MHEAGRRLPTVLKLLMRNAVPRLRNHTTFPKDKRALEAVICHNLLARALADIPREPKYEQDAPRF